MSERRFKDQITDVLTESLPDTAGGALEKWLAPTTESRIEQIPVEQIRDRALRGEVDVTEPAYRALRASIRASGVLQPLLLRPHPDGGYEVVSGARRLRAARDTAQSTVPAVVRPLNDVQALVGGSWDAVLRAGLTQRESSELQAQLVAVGMDSGEAAALVSTAPVRDEPVAVDGAAEVAPPTAPEPVAAVVEPIEAPVVEEPVVPAAEESAPAAEVPAAVEDETAEVPLAVEDAAAVVETTPEPTDAAPVEAASVDAAPVDAALIEPPVVELPEEAAEQQAEAIAEEPAAADAADAVAPADDFEFDEDALGWPAPDQAPADTAPTTPPAPLPVDPEPFPVAPLGGGNGGAGVSAQATLPVEASPEGEINGTAPPAAAEPAEAPAADTAPRVIPINLPEPEVAVPEAQVDEAPEPPSFDAGTPPQAMETTEAAEPEAPAEAPREDAIVVVSPDDSTATETPAPHVIPINLPDASAATAPGEEALAAGSMPVAAPTAEEADPGSRLVATTAPTASEPAAPAARGPVPIPGILRKGPLFYAVLGIGLAVGAIVFILTSVLEGVGGTTSIIAAVVVAVVGFVTAMVSLAQPRPGQ